VTIATDRPVATITETIDLTGAREMHGHDETILIYMTSVTVTGIMPTAITTTVHPSLGPGLRLLRGTATIVNIEG